MSTGIGYHVWCLMDSDDEDWLRELLDLPADDKRVSKRVDKSMWSAELLASPSPMTCTGCLTDLRTMLL